MVKYGGVEFPHSSMANGIKGAALTNKKEKIVTNTVPVYTLITQSSGVGFAFTAIK